jgi:DNA-binding winged helix-turn-helix (wHTH) protein/TolB-like protein/Flp pilus assembly protein TadD
MNGEIGTKDAGSTGGGAAAGPAGVLRFPGFDVDLARGELRVSGAAVALRPKSFALLAHLAGQPGRLLTKDELMAAVWPDVIVTDDSLVQCVSELRAALGEAGQLIKTVPRRGYLFDASPVAGPPAAPAAPAANDLPAISPPAPRRLLPWALALALAGAVALAGLVWLAQPRPAPPAAAISRNTITILPLSGLGDDKAAALAEAVTEDLIVEVSRLPDTLVIGRATAPAGGDADLQSLGRQLGVAYALSGSVERRGEAVAIAVRLQAVASGALILSERFDYADHAGWNWRRDITARIANALTVRLDAALAPFDRPYAGRPFAALDPTLQGMRLLRRLHTREAPARARALFEEALRHDPDSVAALTGQALSHVTEVLGRWSREPERQTALAAEAIERAVGLQPTDPRAHFVRSLVLSAQGRIDEAEQALQRVLVLYPNHPRALQRLGFIKLQQGRPDEVEAPVRQALRLDPLDAEQVSLAHFTLGMAAFHQGRDAAAYALMRQATIASPQNGFPWQWMAAIDALGGREAEARAHLAEYQRRLPGHTIAGLRASEPVRNEAFRQGRDRFYEGLRRAGLPE